MEETNETGDPEETASDTSGEPIGASTDADPDSPADDRPTVRRAVHDRYVGGVAAGLARSLGVDPIAVRVGLVVAALWWPPVSLAYALAWLFIPEEGAQQSLIRSPRDEGHFRQVVGISALGLGAVLLAPDLQSDGGGDARLGVVLLAIGAVLVLGRFGGGWGPGSSSPGSGAPGSVASSGTDLPDTPPAPSPSDDTGEAAATSMAGSRRPRLIPRVLTGTLGWVFLWLVVLVGVGALALDRLGFTVRPGVVVSLALLLVALGLVTSAFRGRAGVLVPVGLLLVPLWVAFAGSNIPRFDGEGNVAFAPVSIEELEPGYTHGYGRLTLDLTEVEFRPGQVVEIDLGLTAGKARVLVPSDAEMRTVVDGGLVTTELWEVWEGRSVRWRQRDESNGLHLGDHTIAAPAQAPTCFEWEVWYEPISEGRWQNEEGTVITAADVEAARLEGRVIGDEGVEPLDPAATEFGELEPAGPEPELILRESRDPDGRDCKGQDPPANPPRVQLNVRIGMGIVEVDHVETPA